MRDEGFHEGGKSYHTTGQAYTIFAILQQQKGTIKESKQHTKSKSLADVEQ